MTWRTWLLGLVLGLTAAACAGLNVGDEAGCFAACERAGICGFLPSALGWSTELELGPSVEDCARRCGNSPRSDPTVSALIACLDGEQQSTDWCGDDTADEYLRWRECAGIAACLEKIAEPRALTGEASLSVSLVAFQDFETDFAADTDTDSGGGEPLTIADLYASPPAMGEPVTACRAALCSNALCAESEENRPCDDTLCRNPSPDVTEVCDSLGIERIILTARQTNRMQVRLTMYDAEDGTKCSMSTHATLAAEEYALVPGPVDLAVQVSGTLLASDLLQIGYPNAEEVVAMKPDDTMPYCLEFYGPSVVLRAGDNPAVIPVGDINEMLERGLDVSSVGVCPD